MRCRSTRCCLLILLFFLQTCFLLYFMIIRNSSAHVSNELKRKDCLCQLRDVNNSEARIHTTPPLSHHKSHQQVYLLVIILSGPNARERRDSIRGTWMQGYDTLHPKVLVKFVIGGLGVAPHTLSSIREEEKQYGDVLLLEDLYESYHNLTLKVLWTFVHVSHSFNVSYLMKCDDDTFVLLERVLEELLKRDSDHRTSFYWGFFNGRARVKRKGKWQERGWFLSNNYLPYALGGGYVLSGDLVDKVAINADSLQLYQSEDVSVGVWLSSFKAERKHDVRFNTEYVSRGCLNVYIVSHKQSIADMKLKYQNIRLIGKQCQKEYQTRLSYIYNWTVPPLECCQRLNGIP